MKVIDAVFLSYKKMPDIFFFGAIISMVRELCNKPGLRDGTISRKFRELNSPKVNKINYKCIDNHKSQYKKIFEKQLKMEL